MRTTSRLVLRTALVAALVLPGFAAAEVVLEARIWSADPSGKIRVNGSSLVETIDLTEDLGLESEEGLDGRLLLRPSRRTLIRAGWTPLTLNGEQVVSRTLRFLGREFEVSSRVESELELEYGRLGFAWQFLSSSDGRFRIGPLIEAKGFRGTATLAAPDLPTPISASEKFEVAFASAGLILDLEPTDKIHVFAEGTVLVDDSEGELTEIEAGARFFVTERLAVVAGIRHLEVDAEDRDDLLILELDGAFAGLSLHF